MSVFGITAPDATVELDEKKRRGSVSFTVSNISGRELEARAQVEPGEPGQAEWYAIKGDPQRTFGPEETEQFRVEIDAPSDAPSGKYGLRLEVVSVENPDEDFAVSPEIAVEVPEEEEPSPEPNGDGFKWWIAAAAAGVLVIGGLVAFLVLGGGGGDGDGGGGGPVAPDVVGLPLEEARDSVEAAGLGLQVAEDSLLGRDELEAIARGTASDSVVVGQEDPDAAGEAVSVTVGRPAPVLEAGMTDTIIDHAFFGIALDRSFPTSPVVLAGAQTTRGADPVGVRIQRPSSGQIQVKLQEEQSDDDETDHNASEVVGYLALEPGPVLDASGQVIGHADTIRTGDTWATVNLPRRFDRPVVLAAISTYNGTHPSQVRLRNVSGGSFDLHVEEWRYLNRAHVDETISYLVVESGAHTLPGGRSLRAGTSTVDHNWISVNFGEEFGSAPLVLALSQSRNGSDPVVTRLRSVTGSGFEARLQEEEGRPPQHTQETLGWVALGEER